MSQLIPKFFILDDADFPDAIEYKRGDESRWYSHPGIVEAAEADIERLTAEVTRYRTALREAYEVWAGSEGLMRPATAPEAYVSGLLEKIVNIITPALTNDARQQEQK